PEPDRRSGSGTAIPDVARTMRRLVSLCRALSSDSHGISNSGRATDAIRLYETLDGAGRVAFLELLIRDFSPSPDDVGRAADDYRQNPSPESLRRLQHVVEPPRQELFRRLNMAAGGTGGLLGMRYV